MTRFGCIQHFFTDASFPASVKSDCLAIARPANKIFHLFQKTLESANVFSKRNEFAEALSAVTQRKETRQETGETNSEIKSALTLLAGAQPRK